MTIWLSKWSFTHIHVQTQIISMCITIQYSYSMLYGIRYWYYIPSDTMTIDCCYLVRLEHCPQLSTFVEVKNGLKILQDKTRPLLVARSKCQIHSQSRPHVNNTFSRSWRVSDETDAVPVCYCCSTWSDHDDIGLSRCTVLTPAFWQPATRSITVLIM